MTTEEKLQHFLDTCMEDARVRSGRMLDEYMTALEKTFEEHKADTRRREKLQLSQETEKIEREINKQLAVGQIDIRRTRRGMCWMLWRMASIRSAIRW